MADWATVQTDKRASCNKPSIMVGRLRIEGRNYKVGVELRRGTHDGGEEIITRCFQPTRRHNKEQQQKARCFFLQNLICSRYFLGNNGACI